MQISFAYVQSAGMLPVNEVYILHTPGKPAMQCLICDRAVRRSTGHGVYFIRPKDRTQPDIDEQKYKEKFTKHGEIWVY